VRLGVALGAHVHPWETLLELVREAEARGFDTAWVDGDASMAPRRADAEVLDGWTVTMALLARTERIAVTSIRLPHHWSPARLAQASATAHRLFGDRFRFAVSVGGQPVDRRFGLPWGSGVERVARLDETLRAVRALWRGETVTGHFAGAELDGARVHPGPVDGRMPILVAARGPRVLEVVAEHADVWDVNEPAVARRVEAAAERLSAACRRRGRDPATVERSQWIFTRADGRAPADPSVLRELRRVSPWFGRVPDAELVEGLAVGDAARCREAVAERAHSLGLDRPILDCTGLDAAGTRRVLAALAPRAEER
jgi:alkanesulfonate monooxygenase SsuD/methylene tetrahydromethanopterin reductase-like flavin-dependent oxidoreductase (luciferase family)